MSASRKKALHRILMWAQRALFAGAILMLGYCAFVLTEASRFQQREVVALTRLREHAASGENSTELRSTDPAGDSGSTETDGLIGKIEIRRLGLAVMVMEGTDEPTLGHAAGHIEGTVMPGEPGNSAIAGHRDTFFRPLRNIRANDLILFTTPQGQFRYRVVSARVVSPDDVSVLESNTDEVLTLVTCYPFYFIGPAPDRFIVRAARVPAS